MIVRGCFLRTTEVLALAESSDQRNLERIRADEGLPIELQQAITAKANGLRARTAAVANYNRAQLRLMYATGQLRHQSFTIHSRDL